MTKPSRVPLVGSIFAFLFVYAGVNLYLTDRWLNSSSDPGWVETQQGMSVVARGIKQDGPAAELLRDGDEIIAINDVFIDNSFMVFDFFQHVRPSSVYAITVRRQGEALIFRLRTTAHPSIFSWGAITAVYVVPLTFLVVGLWIFVGNPEDKQSLLIALALGMTIPEVPLFPLLGQPLWIVTIMMLGRVATFLSFPLYLHFFLVFPKTPHLIHRFPKLQMLLYLLYLPIVYMTIKITWLSAVAPEQAFHYRTSSLGRSRYLIYGVYLLGAIASIIINYTRSSDLSRRRIRILAAGGVIGLLPLIIRFIAISSSSQLTTRAIIYQWPTLVSFLFLLVIPLSFAYAIRRHKVLPIKLIIRRSVGYFIVFQSAVVLELLLVLATVYIILHSLFRYLRVSMTLIAGITIGLTSILVARLVERFHQRAISPKIKQKFFRQAYRAEQILVALADRLRSVVDIEEIAELVTEKLQEALHTRNITFFMQDEETGDYFSAFSYEHTGVGLINNVDNLGLVLHKDGPVIQSFLKGEPVNVEINNPKAPIHLLGSDKSINAELAQREIDVLRDVRSELLVPVAAKEELLGIVSLGPRLGDLPFSWRDRELLGIVAWEVAVSIENAQLVRRKTDEAVLRRELAMGHDVQERLFPQHLQETPVLEFAAASFPAHGVGGDYYDLFVFDPGLYELLVADVSGKGIPAALLMAFIKAGIQTYPVSGNRSLTEIVASLNKLLFEHTEPNKFTTLFYAQLDEATLTLRYVNAGHDEPIVVRNTSSGKKLEGLQSTGGVVGAFEHSTWEQEETKLFTGDLLIVYTDGVTDAVDLQDLRFGKENLLDVIADCINLSAREVVDKVIHAVTGWSIAAPQSDDITVFVVRVK